MNTIRITVPKDNAPEREYAINTLLGLIVDTDKTLIEIIPTNTKDYLIELKAGRIRIKDSFFGLYPEPLTYLQRENLPTPTLSEIPNFGKKLDILYGIPVLEEIKNEIYCGVDIFAGTFFMLSRWEEIVHETTDAHGRFPANKAVSVSYGFIRRPIVNEYAELLRFIMMRLDDKGIVWKERKFWLVPTHDIDYILPRRMFRAFVGDLIKRRSFSTFCERLLSWIKNPVDTFDFLMTLSEKRGLTSRFYFMSASGGGNDNRQYINSSLFLKRIAEIKQRGHVIGFHPGYSTYKQPSEWKKQKEDLERAFEIGIKEGRQHYLMWDVATTPGIWEANGMRTDSTLGYSTISGFRCGTGDEFPLFDVKKRESLNVKERPLIVMDTTYTSFGSKMSEKCKADLEYYSEICREYKMPMTILFHNSNFSKEWKGMKEVYTDFILKQ